VDKSFFLNLVISNFVLIHKKHPANSQQSYRTWWTYGSY